jgi:microsomal dipeptidase-like Zn-dependent dipeptidase
MTFFLPILTIKRIKEIKMLPAKQHLYEKPIKIALCCLLTVTLFSCLFDSDNDPSALNDQTPTELETETETELSFDQAKSLLLNTTVIDGNVNYFSPNSDIGQPNFDTDASNSDTKQSTLINIGAITLTSEEQFIREKNRLDSGFYTGANLITSAESLIDSISSNKYGVIFYTQVHPAINGNINNLDAFYTSGLRVFQLAYNSNSNESEEEKLAGGGDDSTGLTDLGISAVHRLINLGMIVDVSHTSEQTTLDTAEIALTYGIPIIANHAVAFGLRRFIIGSTQERDDRFIRGKTDQEIIAIANTGGIIGIFCYGPWLVQHHGDKVFWSTPTGHFPKGIFKFNWRLIQIG